MMKIKLTALFVSLVVVLLATACSSPASGAPQGDPVSVLTPEEAAGIVENAMQGLKDGDYSAWSRDWSDTMKSAIPEADFLSYHEQLTAQVGPLVSIAPVEMMPSTKEGYVRWSTVGTFEKAQVRFSFSFPFDGRLVEGVFPEAVP